MKAIRIHGFGGPEVLKLDDVPVQQPGDDELNAHYKKERGRFTCGNVHRLSPIPVHGTAQANTSGYQRRDAPHHHTGADVGGEYDGRGGAG